MVLCRIIGTMHIWAIFQMGMKTIVQLSLRRATKQLSKLIYLYMASVPIEYTK